MPRRKPIDPTSTMAESAKECFERLLPRIEAIPEAELIPINVDFPTALSIALGAVPRLEEMVRSMRDRLPEFDVHLISDLRSAALAAWYAHFLTLELGRHTGESPFRTLLQEAVRLRRSLLVAAAALADRGLVSPQRIKEIRRGSGYVDTADDLVALSILFTEIWPLVEHRTAVERHEVDRAGELGPELLVALAGRRRRDAWTYSIDPRAMRERAFTLFVRLYDECRRAVTYLRWSESDAHRIAPSLYSKRRRRAAIETAGSDLPKRVVEAVPAAAPAADEDERSTS